MTIRAYQASDWAAICRVHDSARLHELAASSLSAAFLPLEVAAEREGLFEAEILVLEQDELVLGFVAVAGDELTWLYVDPGQFRRGLGRRLLRAAIGRANRPLSLEVLVGNDAALSLYLSEGFRIAGISAGKLAGNESHAAEAHVLRYEPEEGLAGPGGFSRA